SNGAAVTPPERGKAVLYPSTILVPALGGAITNVTVTLHGLSHTFPQDFDVMLVAPGGKNVVLMSDVGGATPASNLELTFDDTGAALTSGALVSGTYKPTDIDDFQGADLYAAPATAAPFGTALGSLAGIDPQGVWSLYVV